MDKTALKKLENLNQLCLTDDEREDIIAFFEDSFNKLELLNAVNTENVERMVHVMPLETVVREDEVIKQFSREDLQKGAPDVDEGYWCVPKVME